ncbi:MAG: hypothetical protein ACRD7E_07560, partial [Bryobacteraceae bacterium]
MKPAIQRIDVRVEELKQLLEGARAALSAADYQKLKAAIDTLEYLTELVADKDTTIRHLRQLLLGTPGTEKTRDVLRKAGLEPSSAEPEKKPADGQETAGSQRGHGRNGAETFQGASKVEIAHRKLKHGDRCPECEKGNVYGQK